ncbi:MAG: DUF58 domain-containing protein [Pirellulaceae bacterium]|jgi:uncharacterized protein (DUF58 family)|nr:DUF58 domain-containing protein [Pirellulaceae bacterium]
MLAREVLQRVREIQVRTGRQVADVLAGQYVSVFKGRGIEFDEVRPYVPGDEVRTIDWKVTARLGTPYVKRFVEERQLTLMLMADISASQDFGSLTRSKREAAAELCALLAFSATFNNDKVGLTLFHGGIEQYIPARKGQKHALRVVREVLTHETRLDAVPAVPPRILRRRRWWTWPAWRGRARSRRQATNIGGAMEFLMSVSKRRAVCFVVSDFLDDGYLRAMKMANRKHDVIAVLLTDPRELALAPVGLVSVEDPETGQTTEIDTSSAAYRAAFDRAAADRVAELEYAFRSARIDFIHIDLSGSVVDPLARFFRMREKRRQR